MSRKSRSEHVGEKRRAYAYAGPGKRRRILDEVCKTLGYTRKLLPGSVRYRERRGRGRAYGEDVAEALRKVRLEAGCPCLPYFKAESERRAEGTPRRSRTWSRPFALRTYRARLSGMASTAPAGPQKRKEPWVFSIWKTKNHQTIYGVSFLFDKLRSMPCNRRFARSRPRDNASRLLGGVLLPASVNFCRL